jgi:hypothetical protein
MRGALFSLNVLWHRWLGGACGIVARIEGECGIVANVAGLKGSVGLWQLWGVQGLWDCGIVARIEEDLRGPIQAVRRGQQHSSTEGLETQTVR